MHKFKLKNYLLILIIFLAFFLRFYKIDEIPPALYWDETSLGYNAYSILKTARDEHGQFLPITNFAAFGDYKPPGYIYFTVPSIAVFGLNEFAIRFPSAFFGILTVLLAYFLTKKLFENPDSNFKIKNLLFDSKLAQSEQFKIPALAALMLAISPWHLQLSRAAFEANVALFFSLFGIYSFVKFAFGGRLWIIYSAVSFLIALYTFTGQRLFVPLILIVLALQFKKEIVRNLSLVVIVAIFASLLLWPLIKFSTQTIEGKLRFNEVTIFKDLKPINDSILYRKEDNFKIWANVVHNRRLFYLHEYLKHYFDAFYPAFLFVRGDINPRLSTQKIGGLFLFDLLFIVAGTYFLISKRSKFSFLILGWLLVSPLGPATARETPHALRMAHILPTFQILSAYGIYNILSAVKYKKVILSVVFMAIIAFMFYYLNVYYIYWPKTYSNQWQYGYKEAVEIANKHYNQVNNIFVTTKEGRPYIYFLMYMGFDPAKFQNDSVVVKDQFFFIDVDSFGKFKFVKDDINVPLAENSLYILGKDKLPQEADKIKTIHNLENQAVFDIGITK